MYSKRHDYDEELIIELSEKYTNYTKLAREYAKIKGISFEDRIRKKISNLVNNNRNTFNVSNSAKTSDNEYLNSDNKISALVDGKVLGIEEYCKYYGFNFSDVSSYKSVSHNGIPYWNIVFKRVTLDSKIDIKEILRELLEDVLKPIKKKKVKKIKANNFNRVIYTDSHIGMDTGGKNALYPTLWNKETQQRDFNIIADEIIRAKTSSVLYLDDLGDHMDGWNAQTTRGGHHLPQNMDNKEAFKNGVKVKMILADRLAPHFDKIVFNNICNDNHAGDFGYIVNQSFKNIVELKYDNITVVNHESFLNHYGVGNRCYIITHGKDDKNLKFGFKVHIDDKQISKIDAYCKEHKLYRKYDYIEFSKGDSHQCLFDMCSSDDFFYFNYPALSPSSEWVQTNFKRGRRGFVIQDVCLTTNKVNSVPIWL